MVRTWRALVERLVPQRFYTVQPTAPIARVSSSKRKPSCRDAARVRYLTIAEAKRLIFAVPGLDTAGTRALVVGAGHVDRLQHAFEAELLDAIGGDVEILEAPAHLLAGQRLLAEPLLRGADRFNTEHRVDQSARDIRRIARFQNRD